MRVRMLNNPEMIQLVNRETCPVQIVTTEDGFPDELPALKPWLETLNVDPWKRIGCAHWILMDPSGTRVFATSQWIPSENEPVYFGNEASRLQTGLDNYRQVCRLAADVDQQSRSLELEQLYERIDAQVASGFLNAFSETRLYTTCVLHGRGPAKWSKIAELLKSGAGDRVEIAPGVKEAAVHALGDVLTNNRPLHPDALDSVRYIVRPQSEPDDADWTGASDESPVPPSVRRMAAAALSDLLDMSWEEEETSLVSKAQEWWLAHQDDPAYEITWSDVIPIKYAFAVARSQKLQLCDGQCKPPSTQSSLR